MAIESIQKPAFELFSEVLKEPGGASDDGFKSVLGKTISEVDSLLKGADTAATDLAVGKSENLHDAMIAFEKAETALKFLVQVRNKALDAYHEIMRMQV